MSKQDCSSQVFCNTLDQVCKNPNQTTCQALMNGCHGGTHPPSWSCCDNKHTHDIMAYCAKQDYSNAGQSACSFEQQNCKK